MGESDDRPESIPLDTSQDVHVTDTIEGRYIFYTEAIDEYIRTDTVADIQANR